MRFPPISSLRALEAAARHLSYTKAAQELHVTQSAVSHQIRHAEELWELKLFERRGRRVALTQDGQTLVPIVRDFIDGISAALRELRSEGEQASLRVSLLQSFAFKWFVPRLGRFGQRYPDIDVWLSTAEELVDLTSDKADVSIRLGYGEWANLYTELLLREYVFPVCSPQLLEQLGEPEKPADLLTYPLLRRDSPDICPRWRDWFRDAGIEVKKLPRGTKFPDTSMAVQAALDAQGIALARSAHVSDDLASGRLVKLFDVYSESNVAYYFVCPLGRENQATIQAFREWLREEAVAAQAEFDAVVRGPTPIASST